MYPNTPRYLHQKKITFNNDAFASHCESFKYTLTGEHPSQTAKTPQVAMKILRHRTVIPIGSKTGIRLTEDFGRIQEQTRDAGTHFPTLFACSRGTQAQRDSDGRGGAERARRPAAISRPADFSFLRGRERPRTDATRRRMAKGGIEREQAGNQWTIGHHHVFKVKPIW